MVERFEDTGHPVFKSISALSRGILRMLKRKETTHFNADKPKEPVPKCINMCEITRSKQENIHDFVSLDEIQFSNPQDLLQSMSLGINPVGNAEACYPHDNVVGNFSVAPREIRDSNISLHSSTRISFGCIQIECNPKKHSQGMMWVRQ